MLRLRNQSAILVQSSVLVVIVLSLWASSLYSYLLFHGLVEFTTIAIAFSLFFFTANRSRFQINGCLIILGIGYGFISVIDLLHALAYKGMGIFPGYGANLPTQLWIVARSLQALLLCVAPFFVRRKTDEKIIFPVCFVVIASATFLVYSGSFPDCFIEGRGLTPFKIASEYSISAVLVVALLLFTLNREAFSARVYFLITFSILCSIGSELAFTAYLSVYGPANMVGHFLKLAAFYLIYRALVVTGFNEPFELLFRDLNQAQIRLAGEREFSRSLLDSMADGVVACDAEGMLTLFNRTARQWHGLDPLQLPQEEWAQHYDLFRADGVTPLPTEEIPLAMAFNGEEVKEVGMAIVAKGQAPRFIQANGSVILDAEGQKLGAVVVMRDITAFRRLEQELRQSNEVLEQRVEERTAALNRVARTLQEAQRIARIGSWELDWTTNVLNWSDEVYRIFEIDPERFGATYEAFLNAVHPEDREAVDFAYTDSLKNRTPYAIDHRLCCDDGRIKYVHEQCETFYENDKPVRSLGTVQEITERKLAEQALILREHEYHTLLDNIPDLIVRYDAELRRTYVNPAWEKASGLSSGEVTNVAAPTLPQVQQPVITEYLEKLQCVLEHGTTETCSFFWKNAFGAELYLEYVMVPEHDRSGRIIGVLSIGRDLSERRRAEEEMRRLNRELRAISSCNQVLMKAEDEQTLLGDICRIICDEAGYCLAWVGYVEHDLEKTIRPMAWAGVDSDYIAKARLSWSEDHEHGRGPAGMAIRSGEAVHVDDLASAPCMALWRESALARGYRSGIALPLKDESGRVFGVLLIYSAELSSVTAEELKLLEELAGDLSFGIMVLQAGAAKRQAEEDLALNELRYRLGQSAGHIGTWEYDLRTDTLWGSDEAKRIYGFDPERPNFSKLEVEACIPERQRVDQALRDLIDKGTPYNLVFEIHPADGSETKVISSNAELYRDLDGTPIKVVGVIQDITEQKRAEEKMLRSDQRLRLHRERSPLGFLEWDENFCAVDWNAACERIFGYTREEAIGRHAKDLILPVEVHYLVDDIYQSLMSRAGGEHSINENVTKDGRTITCEWFNTTLINKDGKAIGVASVCNDITEQKQMEAELAGYREHLEEQVKKRTSELEEKNAELERLNQLFVGRELRMIELKR